MKLLTILLIATSLIGQTPPTARIIVYQQISHSIPANPLFCDDVQVARLGHRPSYFVLKVSPGEHSFRGKRKADSVIIDAAAGHDYFLQFEPSSFNKFVRETAQEGQVALDMIASGKLRPIDPGDIDDHSRVFLSLDTKK